MMNQPSENTTSIPQKTASERSHLGLKLLCLAVFILTAMPRFRYELAGIPIYFLDVVAVLAYLKSKRLKLPKTETNRRFSTMLIWVVAGICLGQVNNILTTSSSKEAVYMLLRYFAVISLFFTIQRQVRSEADFQWLVRSAVLGLIVTSAISAMVSLPGTRGVVQSYVLSNPMLEPDTEGVNQRLNRSSQSTGRRGVSLVGTSTLTGAFASVLWPLSLIMSGPRAKNDRWKKVGKAASMLAPFGAVLTYSRGALAGFAGAVAGLAMLGRGNARYQSALAATMVVLIIAVVGIDSEVFFFERVSNRMKSTIKGVQTGEFESENEQGRLQSYIEPFMVLTENPVSLILGEGNTRGHTETKANLFSRHSTLGSAHYYFGFLTGVVYIAFFISVIKLTYSSGRRRNSSRADIDRILLASMVAMIPWWLLGHAPISIPRGMALVMLITGLVMANQNLASNEARRRKAVVR